MKVAVIGTGRVGLVSCVALAALGHEVVGTDVDTGKIELMCRVLVLPDGSTADTAVGRLTRAGR